MAKITPFLIFSVLLYYGSVSQFQSFGEEGMTVNNLLESSNRIKDFTVDDDTVYFVELDPKVSQERAFVPDTKLKKIESNGTVRELTREHFMAPRELVVWKDHVYLVTLSNKCIGQTTCNFGDIVRIPKHGGNAEIFVEELAFKVDLAFDEEHVYFTEGNMKLWKARLDGQGIELIAEDNRIPSDMQVAGDYVYYMFGGEEGSIKRVAKGGGVTEELANDLYYPYDMKVFDNFVYWLEGTEESIGPEMFEIVRRIPVNHSGAIENVWNVVALESFADGTILQGSTEVSQDFIFSVAFDKLPGVIRMKSTVDGTVKDLVTTNFLVHNMFFNGDSLYVLGNTPDRYGIWKIELNSMPQFPLRIGNIEIFTENQSSNFFTGSQIEIQSELSNISKEDHTFTYIVQVKDHDSIIVWLDSAEFDLLTHESTKATLSWTPDSAGTYSIEIFLWSDLKNPIPLTPSRNMNVNVI